MKSVRKRPASSSEAKAPPLRPNRPPSHSGRNNGGRPTLRGRIDAAEETAKEAEETAKEAEERAQAAVQRAQEAEECCAALKARISELEGRLRAAEAAVQAQREAYYRFAQERLSTPSSWSQP